MKTLVFVAISILALASMAQDEVKAKEAAAPKQDAETLIKDYEKRAEKESLLKLDGGADIRMRYDVYDNLPNAGKAKAGGAIDPSYVDYYRQRTRAWGSAYVGDYGVYLRLGNEFREYDNYAPKHNYKRFPDQLFVDNLYFDFKKMLYGRVDVRIGRQDIKYGAGRVVEDGTPSDGSRSAYFDAIKVTVRVSEKTSGDFFATYTKPVDNFLTIGNADGQAYNTTSYDGDVGPGKDDDMTEWGIGTYWTIKEITGVPLDLYAIYKDESDWNLKGSTAAKANIPGRQYATLGTRLTPQFTDNFSGELEAAYQFGQTDDNNGQKKPIKGQAINAYMLYGGLTYKANDIYMKPYLTAGALYLSGDDQSSAYNKADASSSITGWNPVYGRCTMIGELPVKMYGSSYRWSNLIYPHIEPGFSPFIGHKFKVQTGPMFADKQDYLADSNENLYRGWYTQAKYEAILLKDIVGKRGAVKAALQLEHMAYGNYYDSYHGESGGDNGYFARIELSMAF
jgi:hypothetical protein